MAVQQTLSIIKPDGVEKQLTGAIMNMFVAGGLKCVAMKMKRLAPYEAQAFYAVHKERLFFGELVEYMCRGPVVIMVLEGENAVQANRQMMGATDPQQAEAGTIRALYASSLQENVVHGSDSIHTAATETAFFFADAEIYSEHGRLVG